MEMNVEALSTSRSFHPEVLKEVGLEVALAFLEVAHELRSGVIPPENFYMRGFHCGTKHCIAGWVDVKVGKSYNDLFYAGDVYGQKGIAHSKWVNGKFVRPPLNRLFSDMNPSSPKWAADAIEEYLYNYAADPWKAAASRAQ